MVGNSGNDDAFEQRISTVIGGLVMQVESLKLQRSQLRTQLAMVEQENERLRREASSGPTDGQAPTG